MLVRKYRGEIELSQGDVMELLSARTTCIHTGAPDADG